MTGRVAYILLWFPERTQTFILDEVNTLTALGLEVRVFTLYGAQRPARLVGLGPVRAPVVRLGLGSLPRVLQEALGARTSFGPDAWPLLRQVLCRRWRSWETAGEALWAALAGVHLARRLVEAGISQIHAPWANGPATAAWVASRLSGLPFSFTARAHDIHPPDGALREKLAAAGFVRVNTAANLAYLASLAPAAASRLVLLRNGVPLRGGLKSLRRPPESPPRLLSLGRLVEKKGFPVLLQAVQLLRRQGLTVHLTLAGDGPQGPRLKRLSRSLGLDGQVSFPGFVPHDRVPRLLAGADLFVLPCRIAASGDRDGIPNAILEALAHGVPVVSTAVAGIPEVIRPGETGWLAPPGDPLALAACLREALADPAEAASRGQAGRELVRREFDSRKNYARLAELFQALERGEAPGGPPCSG
jgi:glycosyltransferase involved in cell wall biosynthesis